MEYSNTTPHAIDEYANIFYNKENEIDNEFYDYVPTQKDIDNFFMIPTPKHKLP